MQNFLLYVCCIPYSYTLLGTNVNGQEAHLFNRIPLGRLFNVYIKDHMILRHVDAIYRDPRHWCLQSQLYNL